MKRPESCDPRSFLQRMIGGALTVFFAVGFLATPAHAEEIPWRQRNFDLQATNEPLNTFLVRLLTIDGISSTTTPMVATGRVNGRFKGKTETVFKELAETYGLAWYYDGITLHICGMSEVETRLLQVDPIDVSRIDKTLKQMRLFDSRFPIRIASSEGQVLVSGPPRYVEIVEQVVARVADSPSRPKIGVEVRVFRLRHARAGDTFVAIGGTETRVAGVASTLSALLSETRGQQEAARQLPRTVRGLRGQGLASIGSAQAAPTVNGAVSAAAALAATAGSVAAPASGVQPPTGLQIPQSPRDGGEARRDFVVRADERLNAVVIRDVRERMPMYEQLINSLDVETALMEIEATVIDISEDKSEQLGIDWRLHTRRADISSSPNNLAGNGATPRSIGNDLLYSDNPLSAGAGLIGTLLFGSERNFFLTRLNALAERGDANLISRPRILTTDNTEAVLQSTKEFYVRVAGREQVDLFNVSLGMVLRVTPTLVEDEQGRRFKLLIRIEDGNTNSGGQVDQIPIVNRNAISTQAVVGEGQSLLIGGYITEERGQSRAGVPYLSDVPVLGWLFGQRGSVARRSERMFMITPRLVNIKAPSERPALVLPSRRETASVGDSVVGEFP
jgi:type III secretion protein C